MIYVTGKVHPNNLANFTAACRQADLIWELQRVGPSGSIYVEFQFHTDFLNTPEYRLIRLYFCPLREAYY